MILDIIKSIISSVIASAIILLFQWLYKKHKERKNKIKKNNTLRNTAIISITAQILMLLFSCASICFYYKNESSLVTFCIFVAVMCFEQAILQTYALYVMAKSLESFSDSIYKIK